MGVSSSVAERSGIEMHEPRPPSNVKNALENRLSQVGLESVPSLAR